MWVWEWGRERESKSWEREWARKRKSVWVQERERERQRKLNRSLKAFPNFQTLQNWISTDELLTGSKLENDCYILKNIYL